MKSKKIVQKASEAEEALYEAFLQCKNKEEIKKFLMDLCTPTEREAMCDRWQVVGPLMADVPYRTIHEQTGVSVTTIGRVARNMIEGQGGYQLVFERLQKKT